MCLSVCLGIRNTACCVCLYAFASFLQKPLSKFIHECSYCAVIVFVILCVSVFRTPVKQGRIQDFSYVGQDFLTSFGGGGGEKVLKIMLVIKYRLIREA